MSESKSDLLQIAERLAELLRDHAGEWKRNVRQRALHVCWEERRIGVAELGMRSLPDTVQYMVGVVERVPNDDGTGEEVERNYVISAQNDRAARDVLMAAMEPWNREHERATVAAIKSSLFSVPGGSSSREAIKAALK